MLPSIAGKILGKCDPIVRCFGVHRRMNCVGDKGHVCGCYNDSDSEWERKQGFSVRVGVHQGSVLSPLLFIIVLEALSRV